MPELPDVTVYLEALERHVVGRALERVQVLTPFLLRSYDPPLEATSARPCAACGASASASCSVSTTISSW